MVFERKNTEKILPYDVRYTLQYCEATLGSPELEDLLNSGFSREALYLSMKAFVRDSDVQRRFLQEIAEAALSDSPDALTSVVRARIGTLPPQTKVEAQKLAQLSRQGFDLFYGKYAAAATRHANAPSQTFLVGHSTFIGLLEFIRSHADLHKPLFILMPTFVASELHPACGYAINHEKVDFLLKGFDCPSPAVIIDDVKKPGKPRKGSKSFGRRNPPVTCPPLSIFLKCSLSPSSDLRGHYMYMYHGPLGRYIPPQIEKQYDGLAL